MEREQGSRVERVAYLEALCKTIPYHIVERVLQDPAERSVGDLSITGSVLIADLVGFTSLCERLAAGGQKSLGRLSSILNALFGSLLDDAIFPYGGYVVQFGGDSVTVFFQGSGHEHRAIAGALACQRIMHGEVGRLVGGPGEQLALRVGIASGLLRLPILGDLNRRVVVCSGPTAHRALDLQQMAEPRSILADVGTAEAVGSDVEHVHPHMKDRVVIRGLRTWPATVPLETLAGRIQSDVEKKIALLQPFVPTALAGRLKTTPKGWRIEGELRTVVVLFSEIWGYDADASPSPEQIDSNRNLARSMLRAYRKYGGMVAKVDLAQRGHRIMVLFGLHMPAGNDAERAVLAGLEATSRVRGFFSEAKPEAGIRTGIHLGRVYFGAIGSDNKHDITVVGDTVNVAARATAQAKSFEVIATEPVLKAVANEFEISTRQAVRVKGKAESLCLGNIHGPSDGRAHYMQPRRHGRFIAGRDVEQKTLNDAVDAGLAGNGTMLSLCGEAGCGKSFLLANTVDRWLKRGKKGILGRCRFATQSSPLAPVATMFESFLGLGQLDSESARRQQIRDGLSPYNLTNGAPELFSLLQPVHRPDGVSEALVDLADPDARERAVSSVVEFLDVRLNQEPILYVLEDLHFADTLTLELVKRLTTLSRRRPFLMICTYRPMSALASLKAVFDEELYLDNLSLAQTTDLITHETQAENVEVELALFLWQRTGGNPGHLLETLRFLQEREMLRVRGGQLVAPDPGITLLEEIVPRTQAQVALARLDDLSTTERRLLRMASAIGHRFNRDILSEVTHADLVPEMMESAMDGLSCHRVIVETAHEKHGYMFRDGTTRVVAYASIPEEEKQEMHRRIASALEKLPNGDLRRAPATLALHWERAQRFDKAAHWYRGAALLAIKTGLDREAVDLVAHWEQAVRRLANEERPTKHARQMALVKFVASARQGAPLNTIRLGRQIVAEHWEDLDFQSRHIVDYWLGRALVAFGKPEKARPRLMRVFEGSDKVKQRSDAARLIGRTFEYAQEYDQALRWFDRATELAGDDSTRLLKLDLLRANIKTDRGDIDGARAMYVDIAVKAKAARALPAESIAVGNLAYSDLLDGKFEPAIIGFERVLRMDRALGDWPGQALDLVNLGQAYLWAGNPMAAKSHLERSLNLSKDLGELLTLGEAKIHLGAVIALTEDLTAGKAICEEGRMLAKNSALREAEIAADLHLLRIAILEGDIECANATLLRCKQHGEHLTTKPLFRGVLGELEKKIPARPVRFQNPTA